MPSCFVAFIPKKAGTSPAESSSLSFTFKTFKNTFYLKGESPQFCTNDGILLLYSRTFNPADYAEPASTEEGYGNSTNNTWNNTGSFEPDDGTSKSPGHRWADVGDVPSELILPPVGDKAKPPFCAAVRTEFFGHVLQGISYPFEPLDVG